MCDHCSCRSYGPIADLTAEHVEVLELAWEIAEGRDVDGAHTTSLLTLMDRHVAKEELGLYPWLLRTGDLASPELARLEDEHVEVRGHLVAGTFGRIEYYALAAHIEEEEMELFPAAMFAFDDDAWADLDRLIRA